MGNVDGPVLSIFPGVGILDSAFEAEGFCIVRGPDLELEPGMYRLGASSFAVLSRERTLISKVFAGLGLKFRIEPVRRRAWRALTAGRWHWPSQKPSSSR